MRSFKSILVANRGEIAVRVMRTAEALGYRKIAVYPEADADAPHVQMADDAVLIGPPPIGESYLDIQRIPRAAGETGAQAVHPGYGFLSESAEFARACGEQDLVCIGPSPEAIDLMGNKAAAKRRMIEAGVPCVPGYEGADQSELALLSAANDIGFPLMVKAAAGGGGRGMRRVDDAADLPDALSTARSEALNAFGIDELILERAIVRPRHVEVQVFADSHGSAIHLGERDGSVQRRHQKVVEEAPCPVMTEALRAEMGVAAVWTGSGWLTTAEAETSPVVKEKLLAATSRQTVRSRSRTGKHSRQLRSPWTDAWQQPGAPDPLPMPLQTLVSEPALAKVTKLAEAGHDGARDLATVWVGQGVGLMNSSQSVRNVVYDFKADFLKAYERLSDTIGG